MTCSRRGIGAHHKLGVSLGLGLQGLLALLGLLLEAASSGGESAGSDSGSHSSSCRVDDGLSLREGWVVDVGRIGLGLLR